MSSLKLAFAHVALVVGCNSGCNSNAKQLDAAVHDAPHGDSAPVDTWPIDAQLIDARVDAPPDAMAHVLTVTCPSGTLPTITTIDSLFAYTPMAVTIAKNAIVKFTMSPGHDVVPDDATGDPGLIVDFGETKCLKFTTTGTFGYKCAPHGFKGSVTVN